MSTSWERWFYSKMFRPMRKKETHLTFITNLCNHLCEAPKLFCYVSILRCIELGRLCRLQVHRRSWLRFSILLERYRRGGRCWAHVSAALVPHRRVCLHSRLNSWADTDTEAAIVWCRRVGETSRQRAQWPWRGVTRCGGGEETLQPAPDAYRRNRLLFFALVRH